METRRGALGALLILATGCAVMEPGLDGSIDASATMDAAMDGAREEDGASPAPPKDGGPPELPDTGPPTCLEPERWYRDLDGDGHGDGAASVESCEPVTGFVRNADDCDDGCASCYPGAAEVCDARDNDCDGQVDQTFACVPGAMIACTTSCGTAGMGACTAECSIPTGAACVPPAEICNGMDDDCDGAVDDSFTCAAGSASVCTTTCGTIGTGTCTAACEPAPASACTPPVESCNGVDDDCDGVPDDGFTCSVGESVSCTTACGTTGTGACTSACELPTGTACAPPAETCNGVDDDCDGVPDDGFACARGTPSSCTTSCGSTGTGTCTSACMPAAASACAPPAETCNYADDDCDGVIDDGVRSLGPRTFHSDYYAFVRPRSARVGTQIYTMWRMNSWVYFWILDSDGEIAPRTHRIQLQTGNHFDLESNGSVPVYAYVDRTTGDVHVHRISASPTAAAPYQWSRTIDTNVQEVELAVGSADVWVYTRSSTGHVQYHTLDLATGALERTTYVGASPKPIAVASNGFIEHLAALYSSTAGAIRWMIRRNDTIDRSGTFAVDDTRLREIAIAGDYTSSGPITRNGVVVVYSMASGGGQPGELYYYSWRADGQTFTQRIITGSAPTSAIAQLDLEMADGTALLGAVWSSYSSSTTGIPRVIELERSTSARYAVRVKTLPVPDAAHEGVSVVRFPARLGAIPDRIFYDPAENGIASIPIGCF